MNEHEEHHELTPDEQRAIDLLIDGELDEASRRELLSSLDYTGDGWRTLALGFLETQALQHQFTQLVTPPAPSSTANLLSTRPPSDRVQSDWGTMLLAMAASFLLAFGLAMLIPRGTPHAGNGAGDVGVPLAGSPIGNGNHDDDGNDDLNRDAEELSVRPLSVPEHASSLVEVASADEPEVVSAVLPVVAGHAAGSRFDQDALSALPRHVQQALERMGHRVETRRQLIPIQLPDGRRVVLPVEEIDVRFVGNRPYQ